MKSILRRSRDERGATAVEYALVIGLVSSLLVAAAVNLGGGFTVWVTALIDTVDGLLNG